MAAEAEERVVAKWGFCFFFNIPAIHSFNILFWNPMLSQF
jgi:hypothetical protein